MFNKNGQKLLNSNYGNVQSAGTNAYAWIQYMGITASNTLTDTSGRTISAAYPFYNTSGLAIDALIQAVTKHTLLGQHGVYSNGSTSPSTSTKDRGVRYHVGYRSGGFNENITTPVDDFNSFVSFSQSYGLKTFTVTNGNASPIVINEISFSCYMTANQSTTYYEILFAGFNLGEITIPAGAAYSFTLTHLMESETT